MTEFHGPEGEMLFARAVCVIQGVKRADVPRSTGTAGLTAHSTAALPRRHLNEEDSVE